MQESRVQQRDGGSVQLQKREALEVSQQATSTSALVAEMSSKLRSAETVSE